ncbi:MAG: ATP-binding cassette domain-containing protein [Gemmatimonas sp.]
MVYLNADSIGKTFNGRRILSSATLRATTGDVRVVFGRNGVGKSTLLKIAGGLVAPDTGIVQINGNTILKPSLAHLARIGVFYLPDHDLFSTSLPLGKQLSFFEQRFERRSVTEAASIANVGRLLDRLPQTLSGGELRRAELAAVLTRRPACLLADEPYRGIAPKDHDSLADIFRAMAADGCAVVLTGHEAASLMELATHITWCTAGTTYELGPPAASREHEAFVREYLSNKR